MSFSDNQNLFPDWLSFSDAFGESSPSTASPASQTSPAGQNVSGPAIASTSTSRVPASASTSTSVRAYARQPSTSGRSSEKATSQATADARRSKKRREWSKEERAEHATIEKKRREDFNDSLMDLARNLPKMKGVKRLNKHNVIRAAAEHAKQEHRIIVEALPDIAALTMERDALLRELNDMRARAGLNTIAKRVEASANLTRLFQVEAETFGTFTDAVFGGVDDERMEEDSAGAGSVTNVAPQQSTFLQQVPTTETQSLGVYPSASQTTFNNAYPGLSFSPVALSPMTTFLNSQDLYNSSLTQFDTRKFPNDNTSSRETFG